MLVCIKCMLYKVYVSEYKVYILYNSVYKDFVVGRSMLCIRNWIKVDVVRVVNEEVIENRWDWKGYRIILC